MRRIGLVLGLAMLLPACGLSAARVEGAQDSAVSPPTTAQAAPSTSEAPAPSTTSAAPGDHAGGSPQHDGIALSSARPEHGGRPLPTSSSTR